MFNVAYKVSKNNANLPDGFVIDHFQTNEDEIEDYLIVSVDVFQNILNSNTELFIKFEKSKISTNPKQAPKASIVNPADILAVNKEKVPADDKSQEDIDNEKLFKEFLAWKNSQNN